MQNYKVFLKSLKYYMETDEMDMELIYALQNEKWSLFKKFSYILNYFGEAGSGIIKGKNILIGGAL